LDERVNREVLHEMYQRTRRVEKGLNERLKDHGLYSSQWSLLFCLDRFGPVSQTDLWKYLNVEAPTVTRTIRRMEANGWVERTEAEDKREKIVSMTPFARERFDAIQRDVIAMESDLLRQLTEEERHELHRLLSKIE